MPCQLRVGDPPVSRGLVTAPRADGRAFDPAWRAKLTEPCRLDLADPLFNGAEVCRILELYTDPAPFGVTETGA
jgi:hypothetical protein